MNNFKMEPADIKVQYKVHEYDQIADLFDLDFHQLSLLLALMGILHDKKISLNENDHLGKEHTFSRTTYSKATTEFDANFGLLTVLDNTDKDYRDVINNIAFEKTGTRGTKYSKLTNVSTFYSYLLGGIGETHKEFFKLGSKKYDIANSIHDFLSSDLDETTQIIDQILIDELDDEVDDQDE